MEAFAVFKLKTPSQQKHVSFFFYCAKNKMGKEQRDKVHFVEFYFL